VEEELKAVPRNTEMVRMDADTVAGGHEKLLRKFEKERIPILLGTQMVAKGLDFENVTLVGVISRRSLAVCGQLIGPRSARSAC
jgi:primosomal protein N' (replication factor Y)